MEREREHECSAAERLGAVTADVLLAAAVLVGCVLFPPLVLGVAGAWVGSVLDRYFRSLGRR